MKLIHSTLDNSSTDEDSIALLDLGDQHSELIPFFSIWSACFRMNFNGFFERCVVDVFGEVGNEFDVSLFRVNNFFGNVEMIGTLPRDLLKFFGSFSKFVERINVSTVAFSELDLGLPNSSKRSAKEHE